MIQNKKLGILCLIFNFLLIEIFSSSNQLFAQNISKSSKIAPPLISPQNSKLPDNLRIKVNQVPEFEKWCKSNLPKLQINQSPINQSIFSIQNPNLELSKNIYECPFSIQNANAETLKKLAECPWVDFVDVGNRKAQVERENDLLGFQVNRISPIHSLYPQLNGLNMGISIKENPFDKTDIDFKGRISNYDNFPTQNTTTHATTMASLMAGGGNSSPTAKGVAWQANLFTSDFANLLPDDGTNLLNQGISVQNHSYGVAIENYYGIESQAYDKQCRENPSLLHVFSSGNSGTLASSTGTYAGIVGYANLTAQFKMSKNTLSIGEISAENLIKPLSSRGPAYDGRVKPELVAYGGAGSSESAALVSGISLLVQQAYQLKFSTLPPASLVKSVLINSAIDLGRPEVDFEYGYGKVNAIGAIKTILEERFIQNKLNVNQEKTYPIQVPANVKKLKITLVWHDTEANVNANQALVNDLDLKLTHISSGNTWQAWALNPYPHLDSLKKNATRNSDHLNNIEQITVALPEAGLYQISVKAFSLQTDNQDFSLSYEYENTSNWIYPNKNDYLLANQAINLEWDWQQAPTAGKIEFKYTKDDTWQTLAELEDLSIGQFDWNLPDTLALFQFRVNDFKLVSDTLLVAKTITPQVGFNCEKELMLYWAKIPNISNYQVYHLGEKHLEAIAKTPDNLLIINKLQENSLHFAVAPVFENRSPIGATINYQLQGTNCYFRTLLVREIINDTINLDLFLGTTYRLTSIALQRRENGIYKTIQQINSPTNAQILLQDIHPQPYVNYYRVELTDNQGNKYLSDEVSAYYLPEDEFLLLPNPVKMGEDLVLLDEKAQIESVEIINVYGQSVSEIGLGFGSFKYIPTNNLVAGLYFLRFKTSSGKSKMKRFIVL